MGRKRKQGVLIDYVVEKIIREYFISTPFIQRKFQVSYLRAQQILKQLEKMGYIEKVKEFEPIRVLKHKYIQ